VESGSDVGFCPSGLRNRARLARLVIPSPSAHPPGSGASAAGQGGAPHRLNDLDPRRLFCSACPGPMAMGWAGFHPSHPKTSTRRQASILEPEVPAGGKLEKRNRQLGIVCWREHR
jgi:hypothetical protein